MCLNIKMPYFNSLLLVFFLHLLLVIVFVAEHFNLLPNAVQFFIRTR